MSTPRPWSYSALNNFENCPRQFHETRVLKRVSTPRSEQLVWGDRVHKMLEHLFRTNPGRDNMPESVKGWGKVVGPLLEAARLADKVLVEEDFALTRELTRTGTFAADVWVRSKADLVLLYGRKAVVVDWKTGKRKDDSVQLRLSAAILMAAYPEVDTVETMFVWLADDCSIDRQTLTRVDVPAIWAELTPRVSAFEASFVADNFPPRQSGLCRAHCPVMTCEFNGRNGR
jgi:hypothetical protein